MPNLLEGWYELRNALYEGDMSHAEKLLKIQPTLLHDRNGIGETVLHFLAVEDCLPAVAWLYQRGASLDTKNEFGTPALFEAAELGYTQLVEWFIANGASTSQTDQYGSDLVSYLQQQDRDEMAALVQKLTGA